ncbi:MAG: orotate phosphoribosyltransferase [Gammaproteobacteria bacterium]|nr:orotate phosphoribosyltransferase [Gammaproteobacteria bacterium]
MTAPQDFVRSMIEQDVLRFGDFTLKSGKQSPYFFNLGNVDNGPGLLELGRSFADCISANGLQPEVLFGPAYKGIPFVVATAIAFAERGVLVEVAHNRKEAKGYGEGGWLVGAELADRRVVMIDDVVVDGSTKIESAELIRNEGGILAGIVIGIDRLEYVNESQTASEALAAQLHVEIYSVATLEDVLPVLRDEPSYADNYRAMSDYATQTCKIGT